MKKTVLITAAIPYVNAAPHIGHALEYVQADVLARHYRQKGDDVCFVCGTDENAFKNVQKAEEAGEEVPLYVERHAAIFRDLLEKLAISNNEFIRTSVDERHIEGAKKLWKSLKEDDLYLKEYTGLYCVGCEEFKLAKDLVGGECPEHPGRALDEVHEKNWFFKLSSYTDELLARIESGALAIAPQSRRNEIVAFLKSGLEDLSVSRSKERMHGWGIEVPGDASQVMYVWIDALSNYSNAVGYASDPERFKKYWTEADKVVHVIGKGITRFHAIYWPALLLSAGVRVPSHIFAHAYLTVDGQKMSKSLGNVIDPFALVTQFGTDAFRYFFLREVSPFEDSDVTLARFHEAYTANLVNGIGNLTSRVMKMATTHLPVPVVADGVLVRRDEVVAAVEGYEFHHALDLIFEEVGAADSFVQETQPFKGVKDPATKEKALEDIRELVERLYQIAIDLEPFLPETSKKIQEAVLTHTMPEPLFPRIDVTK